MLPQQRLREAIEAEINRRIAEALKQYELHVRGGTAEDFRLSIPHDNAAVRELQDAIALALRG